MIGRVVAARSKTMDFIGCFRGGKPVKPTASTGFMERAMGIEPKNYIVSLADSKPLAPISHSHPEYQYPVLDYSWTTNLGRRIGI